MEEYKDSKTVLVADVDCTAEGKAKCDEVGVQGFPTIKYGDPDDMQDYDGGRSYDDIKKFADGLGPMCSPANLELCDEEKKKQMEEFSAYSIEERAKMIDEKEEEIKKLEKELEEFLETLQKQYSEASEKKDKDVAALKNSGLGLLKSVHAYAKKNAKTEL
mmetsp:Transcript_10482/g.32531  ORF Transcript_10482/g.32531 Transcript_10482/m.32531 type:complete len:161 (-) Transcript_10482:506-988(-)